MARRRKAATRARPQPWGASLLARPWSPTGGTWTGSFLRGRGSFGLPSAPCPTRRRQTPPTSRTFPSSASASRCRPTSSTPRPLSRDCRPSARTLRTGRSSPSTTALWHPRSAPPSRRLSSPTPGSLVSLATRSRALGTRGGPTSRGTCLPPCRWTAPFRSRRLSSSSFRA